MAKATRIPPTSAPAPSAVPPAPAPTPAPVPPAPTASKGKGSDSEVNGADLAESLVRDVGKAVLSTCLKESDPVAALRARVETVVGRMGALVDLLADPRQQVANPADRRESLSLIAYVDGWVCGGRAARAAARRIAEARRKARAAK